jgi:predicted RNA-binding protein with EMAP domain
MATTSEKKKVSKSVDEVTNAMQEVAYNPDTPEEIREELEEDVKFFRYMKEKLETGYSWGRKKLRNLGRRIRDFAHTCIEWLKKAYDAIVNALGKALAWLVRTIESALNALADVADRFVRVVFPSKEDVAQAQLEDINEAATEAAKKAVA